MRDEMARTFLFVSALEPDVAARAVADTTAPPQVCVTSPSQSARDVAAYTLGGRWVFTIEEPLLTARAPGESGNDVVARLAQAFRGLRAYDADSVLVVVDHLDILGASAFVFDEPGLMRYADELDRFLPLP